MEEKAFILQEACTAEDRRPWSEWMLRGHMSLYSSSVFSIYQVTSMETLCTQQLQGKAGQEKKGKGIGTWFTRAFSASSSFPFYCHTHP